MTPALLGIGVFGLLGLSVLWPLLAFPARRFQRVIRTRTRRPESTVFSRPSTIEIVLPAHNEAGLIEGTLAGIQRSIRHLQAQSGGPPPPEIFVHVGTDGCTDQTAQIARRFPKVDVTEFGENRGKWRMIKTLFERSTADWLILVDAGTLWPESFLTDVVQRIGRGRDVIAVAPSYRPLKAGRIHRALWHVEAGLKKLEALCGGPVSLHGATVGYKTAVLKKALARLGDTPWLNDDVVIPLTLRALFPDGLILYPVGEVWDAGLKTQELDLARRDRLLKGNLQWVRLLLPDYFRRNPVAGLVALRRLFRVFWAYWFVFAAAGLALAFHSIVLPGIAAAAILFTVSGSFRQLAGAAWVSLSAPWGMIHPRWRRTGSWT